MSQLSSRRANIQGPPTAPCGQSKEERSMKEILETPVDRTGHDFILEQVEEAVIVNEEELVEDLGDAELPWESRVMENSVKNITIDDKEDCAQLPKQVFYEELDGIIQEASFLDDDNLKSSSPSNELASASEFSEIEESSPSEYKDDAEVDFSQPPVYDLSDEEDIKGFDQDMDAIE